jgi:hypothetical protein
MQRTFVAGGPRIPPDNSIKMLFEACWYYVDSSRKGVELLDRNGKAARYASADGGGRQLPDLLRCHVAAHEGG